MKIYNIILGGLLLTSIVSCDGNDFIPEAPEQPQQPAESYKFTFGGSTDVDEEATRASWTSTENSNKLVFGWDYTDKNNPTYDMKMAFLSANGTPLQSSKYKNYTDVVILQHSTKADDRHWAEFETVESYSKPLKNYDGYTLIAVNGKNSTVTTRPSFAMKLSMPSAFTQSAAGSLAHLSDYMYMYAVDMVKNGNAHLKFEHLTAPVRFRIHNWRPCAAKIYSVEMTTTDGASLASSSVSVGAKVPTYSSGHKSIAVNAASNSYFTIAEYSKDKPTIDLYAHVLPLSSTDPLKGKTLQFTIKADGIASGQVEYLTIDNIEINKYSDHFPNYNWKAGDIYTFHIYLDDAIKGITVESVSIKDWEEGYLPDSETM